MNSTLKMLLYVIPLAFGHVLEVVLAAAVIDTKIWLVIFLTTLINGALALSAWYSLDYARTATGQAKLMKVQ